jgi:hypothetical protein
VLATFSPRYGISRISSECRGSKVRPFADTLRDGVRRAKRRTGVLPRALLRRYGCAEYDSRFCVTAACAASRSQSGASRPGRRKRGLGLDCRSPRSPPPRSLSMKFTKEDESSGSILAKRRLVVKMSQFWQSSGLAHRPAAASAGVACPLGFRRIEVTVCFHAVADRAPGGDHWTSPDCGMQSDHVPPGAARTPISAPH